MTTDDQGFSQARENQRALAKRKEELRREQQREIKEFVTLCKNCLKMIQNMPKLQTIVPDLFSGRPYPGETAPLSPSEIVQRFQEDKFHILTRRRMAWSVKKQRYMP